jgi:hypothetical protein
MFSGTPENHPTHQASVTAASRERDQASNLSVA